MKHEDEQGGMSTGKKIAAGAAVGLAVPAAVGVAKKLMSDGDEGTSARSRRTGSSRGKTRSSSGSPRSRSRSTRSTSSASRRTRSGSKSRAPSSSRSSGSSSRSGGRTKEELYNQAKRLNIEGRSSMTKAQLERAISRKRS